ncbi:MAG: thioredoxin family protein [Candidatus Cloacimonetes bacterium]|nr:thioredoxin family protein [Candidatus Cloacimonadota bacterium]
MKRVFFVIILFSCGFIFSSDSYQEIPKVQLLIFYQKNMRIALENLNINAEVEKVTDISEIMKYNVMMTPALVIDGEVKSTGRVFSPKELEKILQTK